MTLSRLTRVTEGDDVARKYLAQAEGDFRKAIDMGRRDDYGYVSLAELYREWAERAKSDEDANAYLRKAEETIADGLRHSSTHDRLHIESSKIADALGRQPERLAALKRAVESGESASVVARFMYGRALRLNGQFEEAVSVLRPILLDDPNAYRAAIEYAEASVTLSGRFMEGVAILKQAALFGMKDARFVATLGGMLFLARRLDDAESTFSSGRQLPAEEQRRVR
jgi:Flp pilus assembly protein TadD